MAILFFYKRHFDKRCGCLFTPHCLDRLVDNLINHCMWTMGASLLWIISVWGPRQVLQMEKAPIHYQHLHYCHYQPATAHRQREGRGDANPVAFINNKGQRLNVCDFPHGESWGVRQETWASNPSDVTKAAPASQRWKEQTLMSQSD